MFLKKYFSNYVTKIQHDKDFSDLILQYSELEKKFNALKAEFDSDVKEQIEAEARAQKAFTDGIASISNYSYQTALKSGEKV